MNFTLISRHRVHISSSSFFISQKTRLQVKIPPRLFENLATELYGLCLYFKCLITDDEFESIESFGKPRKWSGSMPLDIQS